jgi:hypothetical protein
MIRRRPPTPEQTRLLRELAAIVAKLPPARRQRLLGHAAELDKQAITAESERIVERIKQRDATFSQVEAAHERETQQDLERLEELAEQLERMENATNDDQ